MKPIDQLLKSYYTEYRRGHEAQRARLLATIAGGHTGRQASPIQGDFSGGRSYAHYRRVLAVAAMLMILLGGAYLLTLDSSHSTTDTVWASAVSQTERLQSVHMRVSTFTAGPESCQSLEMWWRRPHEFRMEFAQNGLVVTGNRQHRCHYLPSTHNLTIYNSDSPGLEMAILGEFGDLFGSKQSLTQGWVHDSELKNKETITYKGEPCYQLTFEKGHRGYKCVVNEKGSLIYEATVYAVNQPEKVLQKIEILDIDTEMADSLFEITPQTGDHVKNLVP